MPKYSLDNSLPTDVSRQLKLVKEKLLPEKSVIETLDAHVLLQQRLDALENLRSLFQTQSFAVVPCWQLIQFLRFTLLELLRNSSVNLVMSACSCLRLIYEVKSLSDGDEVISGWFGASLLQLSGSSFSAVSEASKDILLIIARSGAFNFEFVAEVLRCCIVMHSWHRWVPYLVLLTLMFNAQGTKKQHLLSKFNVQIENIVGKGLGDTNEDVRRVSVRCFNLLLENEPEMAKTMYARLSPAAGKLLKEDDSVAPTISVPSEKQSLMDLDKVKPRYMETRRKSSLSQTVTEGYDTYDLQRFKDDLSNTSARQARQTKKQLYVPRRTESITHRRNSHFSESGLVDFSIQEKSLHVAKPIVLDYTGATSSASSPFANKRFLGDRKETKDEKVVHLQSAEEISSCVSLLSNTEWETRLNALLSLKFFVKKNSGAKSDQSLLIIKELPKSLADPNFQVMLASLELYEALIANHWDAIYKDASLFFNVFVKAATHSRKEISRKALSCLKDFMDRLDLKKYSDVVLRCLHEVSTLKAQLVAAQTLEHVIDFSKSELRENSAGITQILDAACFVFSLVKRNRARVLGDVATRILSKLYDVSQHAFLNYLLSVTKQEGEETILLLSEVIPSLPSDLKHFSTRNFDALSHSHALPTASLSPASRTFENVSALDKSKSGPLYEDNGIMRFSSSTGGTRKGKYLKSTKNQPSISVTEKIYYENKYVFDSLFFLSDTDKASMKRAWSIAIERTSEELDDSLHRLSPDEIMLQLFQGNEIRNRLNFLQIVLVSLWNSPQQWSEENQNLLLTRLSHFGDESNEPIHSIRIAAFQLLHAFVYNKDFHRSVSRRVFEILCLCRCGLDDSFPEVQQEAASVVQILLHSPSSFLSLDLLLHAFYNVLLQWVRGDDADDCTKGWLEMIVSVGKIFERALSVFELESPIKEKVLATTPLKRGTVKQIASLLSEHLVNHCASPVRQKAMSILAVIFFTFGKESLPYLDSLSDTQRGMLSDCYRDLFYESNSLIFSQDLEEI